MTEIRVVVTGADGFVGQRVRARLEHLGAEVHSLGLDTGADVRDLTKLETALRDIRPDVLVHLAAVSGPTLLRDQPDVVVDVNCRGTVNVLEAARRTGGVRTVMASSVSGYTSGTPDAPVPVSVYGATKRFAETLCALYRGTFGLECTSVRIGSVYGPGRRTNDTVSDMMLEGVADGSIHYDPRGYEPLVHIADAANLLASLAFVSAWADEYDLVATPLSHHRLAELVRENLHPRPELIPQAPISARTWPVPFDIDPLLNDTGQVVAVPAADGIAETVRVKRFRG